MNAAVPSPFMERALALAAAVRGTTSPNPWVGAVLVREGTVIAEGATSPPGGNHAEANALAEVDARGATLYVTLEPCAPFPGKRTPPCSERAIAAGIARAVVALPDPDARVAGLGIAAMRAAGITVEVGDGAEVATALLRPYLKHRATGMPYVIAKWASSLDGRTATANGDSKWITGEAARALVHDQRAWVDAILTGSGTVLADDPALTARPGGIAAARQPLRVVLDTSGRIPPSAALFREPGPIVIATTRRASRPWREAVVAAGAQVLECEDAPAGVGLRQLLRTLAQRGVLSLWVEAGATVLGSLFDDELVDETWAFLAPKIIGGTGRPAVGGEGAPFVSAAPSLRSVHVQRLGDDVLVRGYCGPWEPAPTGEGDILRI